MRAPKGTPAQGGDVLEAIECLCGPRLVRPAADRNCERCRHHAYVTATLTLEPDGSIPDPATWDVVR